MDRKFKVIGIYIGLLVVVSILLILVTSFSNSKMDPSYQVENEEKLNSVSFDSTLEQNVNTLTENNRILNEKVKELNLQLEEKEKIIEEYKNVYNEDSFNLQKAIKYYIIDEFEEAKINLELVKSENLNDEDNRVYNNLVNKLN